MPYFGDMRHSHPDRERLSLCKKLSLGDDTRNRLITSITPKKRPISDYRESRFNSRNNTPLMPVQIFRMTSSTSLEESRALKERLQSPWSFSNQHIYGDNGKKNETIVIQAFPRKASPHKTARLE